MQKLHEIAELALKYVNTTNRHVFLTGKAGTGKTTLLKQIIDNTYKNAVVAAPTGIAAINAGGVTLHSLLQLPFGTFVPENIPLSESSELVNTPQTIFRGRKMNKTKRKLLQELELLIIDEVSMLRADLLDCIDLILRSIRKRRNEPFGGVQILFIGDLLQLPPVVKESEKALLNRFYPSAYFFEALALKNAPLIKVELQKIYRQSDDQFIGVLNRLRHNEQQPDDYKMLNQYYQPDFEQSAADGYIHLTTHNRKADQINKERLEELDAPLKTFSAHIGGNFPENMYPTEVDLKLKEGAQVMFIKNDPSGQGLFFNGKIGEVVNLDNNEVTVRTDDGLEIEVERYTWENKRYTLNKTTNEIDEKHLGSFEQLPIKLAWAVTIHKSQGLTFEKAILDLSQTFASGQLYVALSRLTSLDGLILSSKLPEAPPEPEASLTDFTKSYLSADQLHEQLGENRKQFIQGAIKSAFSFELLHKTFTNHYYSFNKAENRSEKQKYQPFAQELMQKTGDWLAIGNKFIRQAYDIINKEDYIKPLAERAKKASSYFSPLLAEVAKEINTHRKSLGKQDKVKAYIKELESLNDTLIRQHKQIIKTALLLQAASENKILTKEQLQSDTDYQSIFTIKKQKKKDKTPTAEVSYGMFKEGKSIEYIAEARGLVPGTIEGHLCQYIENGEIAIDEVIPKDKLLNIEKCRDMGMEKLSEYKTALDDTYSYGEIKMAMAHFNRLKESDNK